MGILTTQFPELPKFVKSDKCTEIVIRGSETGKLYGLICTDDIGLEYHYLYRPDVEFAWTGGTLNSPQIHKSAKVIYSTYDIYDEDNNLISVGVSKQELLNNIDNYSTVGFNSSSTFLSSLNGVKVLLPAVVLLTVGCFAIRKAYNFLKLTLKGA